MNVCYIISVKKNKSSQLMWLKDLEDKRLYIDLWYVKNWWLQIEQFKWTVNEHSLLRRINRDIRGDRIKRVLNILEKWCMVFGQNQNFKSTRRYSLLFLSYDCFVNLCIHTYTHIIIYIYMYVCIWYYYTTILLLPPIIQLILFKTFKKNVFRNSINECRREDWFSSTEFFKRLFVCVCVSMCFFYLNCHL